MKQIDELVERKRCSNFIERSFKYQGYDFSHDRYKQIISSLIDSDTLLEEE